MHREVIETVNEFMNLCATTNSSVNVNWVLQSIIAKANAHLKLEEWQTALDLLKPLYEACKDGYCYFVAAGISRAQYELQNYHEASLEGVRAVYQNNRRHAGVHKYIALSQMKLGDTDGAKKSITRGILYEEQWNEENRKENEDVLRMILAEEAKNQKPKSSKKKGKKKKGRGKK